MFPSLNVGEKKLLTKTSLKHIGLVAENPHSLL